VFAGSWSGGHFFFLKNQWPQKAGEDCFQVVALDLGKSSDGRDGEEAERVRPHGRRVRWPRAAHLPRDLNPDLVHLDHAGIVVVENSNLYFLILD